MSLLATLATIFGTFGSIANIPQIVKIFKRKSAKDIAVLTYFMLFACTVVWVLYGVEIGNLPIIITNALSGFSLVFIIAGWFLYGREK